MFGSRSVYLSTEIVHVGAALMVAGSASVAASRDHIRARNFVPSVDEKKYYNHARVMRRAQKAARSSWQVVAAAAAGAVQLEMVTALCKRGMVCSCGAVQRFAAP